MRRLVISGLALSNPGTMGGNSKITIEIARNLSKMMPVHIVVPGNKVKTLTDAGVAPGDVRIHAVEAFPGNDKYSPAASVRFFLPRVRAVFRRIGVSREDIVFACSDFHCDVVPLYVLKKEFGFLWLPSVFLFPPGVWENLTRRYRFPVFLYALYRLYNRVLVRMMARRADGFVITNDSDRSKLPARFKDRLFAFYGGVNVEQIPLGECERARDAVFCSRLHPQKGIRDFLDVWAAVCGRVGGVRLTVIGNGAPSYEAMLKRRAERLGIAGRVEWLGYVNNEEKYAVYRSAKVFVHPTVFDNNGMVAAEALCSGLPVVMYDLPALRSLYTTGCVKVPQRDKRAFADVLVRLLTEKAYRESAAPTPEEAAALRRRWDWPRRAELFAKFLESLRG